MTALLCNDWRELSKAAAQEQDPKKLLELVEELNRVLEERERKLSELRAPNSSHRQGYSATSFYSPSVV